MSSRNGERRSGPEPRPGRWSGRRAVHLGAMAGVIALGGWSLTATADAAVSADGQFAVPGGTVRVDSASSPARPRHAMPGMGTDNDPVAEGRRRVTVAVTIAATDGDRPVRYAADAFSLRVGGEPLAPHRSILPAGTLPVGAHVTGALVFDVPADSRTGVLAFAGGGAARVDLPAEVGSPTSSTDHQHASREGTS